jgi:hypothetical protein
MIPALLRRLEAAVAALAAVSLILPLVAATATLAVSAC